MNVKLGTTFGLTGEALKHACTELIKARFFAWRRCNGIAFDRDKLHLIQVRETGVENFQ